jgi:alpha-tubulin suppressor-like RCC1 family protein
MAKLTGRVTPQAGHKRVELQVRAGGRWWTVASRSLSKSSAFAFTTRLSGVGGHFVRVVKPFGSGHGQGVSNIVELIVPGRQTVRSQGGALHMSLGAVHVSAPKGAIGKGKTLSISVGVPTGFGAEGASSVSGGPYLLSTSQGEPHKPVTVTVGYDPGLLAPGDKPLLLHGWTVTHKWVPEITTVHGHSVSATLDSFSPIDVIDWGTYYAGILTGNRAGLPGKCGQPPSWVDSVTLPDSNQDPLPACFNSEYSLSETEAVLNVVNNRGYAQTVTVSGAEIDVAKSVFASSFEGQIGKLLAQPSSGNGPSAFVLGPGESASITIDAPPPQLAAQEVHIDPAPKTASGVGELAWALLTTAKDQIGVPLDIENCVMAAVYNTVSADRGPDSAIAQMHSCVDAAATGTAKGVLEKLAYGLLVDDFFYKIIDLEGDELYPAQIGFTIPGSNPTFTNPNIHIGPANYGTLPDGQTTVEHLTATGGVPPYRYYIWNEPENAAKVPSWVKLATDGTLTIEPPASASGEVSFYVYAFDSKGEHSPFARDQVSFRSLSGTGPPEEAVSNTISAGSTYACALVGGDRIDCWGVSDIIRSSVALAINSVTDVIAFGTGWYHACVLLNDRSLACWGENDQGQLGDATTTESPTPVVVSGITNAAAISVGGEHSCALFNGGRIECWGANWYGQLGDGTTTSSSTPVIVSGITNATAVSAGGDDTCALLSGGSIVCWGANELGQLGDGTQGYGTYAYSSTPVAVSGIANSTGISAGDQDTCALLSGGSIKCWGANRSGQLGNGTNVDSSTPVSVSGITGATAVSVGGQHSCALLSGGSIECWGANDYGELGDGAYSTSWTPVAVSGIANATAVSAGAGLLDPNARPYDYTCASLVGGIDCWGSNADWALGDGRAESSSPTPVMVTGIG